MLWWTKTNVKVYHDANTIYGKIQALTYMLYYVRENGVVKETRPFTPSYFYSSEYAPLVNTVYNLEGLK